MRLTPVLASILLASCSAETGTPDLGAGKGTDVSKAPAPTGYSAACARRLRDIVLSGVSEAKQGDVDLKAVDPSDPQMQIVADSVARMAERAPELAEIDGAAEVLDVHLNGGNRVVHVISTDPSASFAFDASGTLVASYVSTNRVGVEFYCEGGDAAVTTPVEAYSDYCGGGYFFTAPHDTSTEVRSSGIYKLGTVATPASDGDDAILEAVRFQMVEEAGTHFLRANGMTEARYEMTFWGDGAEAALVRLEKNENEAVTYLVARHLLIWGVTPVVLDWVDASGEVHAVCERRDDDGNEPAAPVDEEPPGQP